MNPITETARALGNTPEGKVWRAAFTRLFVVGCLALLVLFLHSFALWIWPRTKWTRDKPLPEILVFPRLEIIFFNVTLVSTTQVRHLVGIGVCAVLQGGALNACMPEEVG